MSFNGIVMAALVLVALIAGVVAWRLGPAPRTPSTRRGTTRLMFAMAGLSGFGGPIAGIVLMVHTSEPGCTGWVSCGTNHPLIGAGVACMVTGLLLSALFGAVGLIARSVGEMQAATLGGVNRGEPWRSAQSTGAF